MQAKDLMKNAYTIDKDIKLSDAAKIMSSRGASSLIFVSNGKIKGIVSEKDLLRNFGANMKVSEVMTKRIVSIKPDDEITTILQIMKKNSKRKIPVVEKGKLLGIVNLIDVAKHSEELEEGFFFD